MTKVRKILTWIVIAICIFLAICYGVYKVRGVSKKPIPKSPLYVYDAFFKDDRKLPIMKDEIIAEFEKHAKNFEKEIPIAKKDEAKGHEGTWVYIAMKTVGTPEQKYRWIAFLEGDKDSSFIDERGRKIQEMHFAFIDIMADAKTYQIKKVSVGKHHVTKETGRRGKYEMLYEKIYK